MTLYVGSLRIAETNDVVEAQFDVAEDELTVSTDGEQLGTWPLREIGLDDTGTEIYMALGGEDVIVNMRDRDAFVAAITPPKKARARHAKPKRTRPEMPHMLGAVRRLVDRDQWRDWLSDRLVRWVIASGVVIIVALLALFATSSLGMVLVLGGMVAMVIAALAVSEDLSAVSWVPEQLSEATLVMIGVAAMALGGLLIFLD
ncbi:MAG: hypothetical protein WBV06_08430 [Acidimicrobiia bacterium]|jgi:hypothetical protein